jgi:hypothetical protein
MLDVAESSTVPGLPDQCAKTRVKEHKPRAINVVKYKHYSAGHHRCSDRSGSNNLSTVWRIPNVAVTRSL